MHCLLLSPWLKTERGNAITVRRLAMGLAAQGLKVGAAGFYEESVDIGTDVDLVHGFHAYHFGSRVLALMRTEIPVILTMTGTDYNIDLLNAERREIVEAAVRRAQRLIVFHSRAAEALSARIARIADKLHIVPPGIYLPSVKIEFPIPDFAGDAPVILIVAGIRRVKNITEAIASGRHLIRRGVRFKMIHAGSTLEENTAYELRQAAEGLSWFKSLGEVPHHCMRALYNQAAVVINTSLSEAIPNSILEAMACRRPVVVSAIPGNLAVVQHGVNGLVYRTVDELAENIMRILSEPSLAERLSCTGQSHVLQHFSMEREVAEHIRIYRSVAP